MSDNPKPANVGIAPWTFEEDQPNERLPDLANVTIRDCQNLVVTNVFDIGPRARANAAFICEAVNYYISQNPRVQIRRLRAERDRLRTVLSEVARTSEHALAYANPTAVPGGQAAFCQVAPEDLKLILALCRDEVKPSGSDNLRNYARSLVDLVDNLLAFYEYRTRDHQPSKDFVMHQREFLSEVRKEIRRTKPSSAPAAPSAGKEGA